MKPHAVVLTPDYESGEYTVNVPAFPGCVTDGETIDETLERGREAILLDLRGENLSRFSEPGDGSNVTVAQANMRELKRGS